MNRIFYSAVGLILSLGGLLQAAPFSVDIVWMRYFDDTGRDIVYDFTDGVVNYENTIEIPASAVAGRASGEPDAVFLWESTVHDPGSLDLLTDQGLSRLSVPVWHFNGNPDDDYIGDFASLGAWNCAQTAPQNWTYRVRVTNFSNPDIADTAMFRFNYVAAGLGSWDAPSECYVHAEWFTGWHEGVFYENALVVRAEVDDEVQDEEWESEPIIVQGLDPLTDAVEFKLRIRSGTSFSSYFRINDDDWRTICENYQTPYAIPGFPMMFPTLEIENGVQNPALNKFQMAELAAISGWWQADDCVYDNYFCQGADINQDGEVDWTDLVLFAEHWCTVL